MPQDAIQSGAHVLLIGFEFVSLSEPVVDVDLDSVVELVVEEGTPCAWHDFEESICRGLDSFVHGFAEVGVGVRRHEVWNFPNISATTNNCVTNDVIEFTPGSWSFFGDVPTTNAELSCFVIAHFGHV